MNSTARALVTGALVLLAAVLLFAILYAVLTTFPPDGPRRFHHAPHPHHGSAQQGTNCGCSSDTPGTGTAPSPGSQTGTTAAQPVNPAGPPALSTPFFDIFCAPARPPTVTTNTHSTEWKNTWSVGSLADMDINAPRIEFYYSDMCPACKRFKPIWDESVNWFPSRLQRAVVSCSDSANIAACRAVQSIPTVIYRSKLTDAGVIMTAPKTKEALLEFVNSNYSKDDDC